MKKNLLPKQKLFFVLTLFALLFGGILKSQAQGAGISLSWNKAVGCEIYSEDRKDVFLEEIVEGECIEVCKGSSVIYTLNDLPSGATTVWTVSGGTMSSILNNKVTVNWTGIEDAEISFAITTANGVVTGTLCITIIQGPQASFSSSPFLTSEIIKACSEQNIFFTNTSQTNGGSDIVSYYWNFGDGNYSDAQNPSHSFANPGTYHVSLTVTNSCNCTSTFRREVQIERRGFDIICPSIVCEGQTALYSLPEQANSACNGFNWSVIGGTIIGSTSSNSVKVRWDNVDADGFGYITFTPSQCSLPCVFPTTTRIPVIKTNGTIEGNTSLCLGEQGRYALPQWPTTDFQWHIENNGSGQLGTIIQTDQRNEIILTPTQAGTITLIATYNNTLIHCGGTAKLVINVKSPEPFTGESVVCLGTSSTYATVSTNPVTWTLKNSSGTTVGSQNNTNTFTHVFNTVGNFTLTVSGTGICNGQTKNIVVKPALAAPVLDAPATLVCPNAPYTYAVTNPDPNSTYLWEIVNGTILGSATGSEVNVTFLGSGQIKVKKQQINPVGCDSPFTVQTVTSVTINADISTTTAVIQQIVSCSNNYFTYRAINSTGGIYNDPGSNYTWSINPSTAGSISSGQGTNTVEVLWNNVTAPQNYQLIVVITKCTVVANVVKTITVTPIPAITITGNNSVCSGVGISFNINSSTPLASGTVVNWVFGNGQTMNAPAGTAVTMSYNNGNGVNNNYTITASIASPNLCTGTITASKNIVVTPGPNASASNVTGVNSFCNAANVNVTLLAGTTGGATIKWYKNTLANQVGTGGTLNVGPSLNFGTYFFVATLNGCTTQSNGITIFNNCNEPAECTISPNPTTSISWANNCGSLLLTGNASGTPLSRRWTINGPGVSISNVPSNTGSNQYLLTTLQAGQYTVLFSTAYTGTTGQPCTRTVSQIVTVPYVPNFKISATCGPVVNNTTTYNVTLTDDSNFLTTITSKMWQYELSTTGGAPWTMLSAFSTTANFTLPSSLAAGNYYIRQSIKGSLGGTAQPVCTKILPLSLMNMNSLSIAFLQPPCFDTAVAFNIPGTDPLNGDTFLWTFDNVTVQNTNSNPKRVFDETLAGTNNFQISVKVTNKYGCFKILYANVNIPLKCFNGDIVSNPPNATVCKGDSVILSYNAGSLADNCPISSYQWMNGTTVLATTSTNSFAVSTPGFYTVKVSNGSCDYTSPTIIKPIFLNLPTLTLSGPTTLCLGDEAVFNATSNATAIKWTIDGSYTAAFDDQEGISLPDLYLGTHDISVTVTSSDGCTKTMAQTIEVVPAPAEVTIYTPVLQDCQTYRIKLTAFANGTGTYNWSNGAVATNNPDGSSSITVNEGGAYMVTFTNEGGCSTTFQVYVPRSPKAYMWVFPTGCYSKCKDEEAFLLGPILPMSTWSWLQDGTPDTSGSNSVPADYPLTESGTFNMQLNTGLCNFTTPSMSLSASDCVACSLGVEVREVKFVDNHICLSMVTLIIHSNYGIDIQGSVVSNTNDLIINPGSITIVPGFNMFTFSVIPINGFNGGVTALSLIGTIMADGIIKNCVTPIDVDLRICNSEQARPAALNDTEQQAISSKGNIMLYPNPAQDKVNIRFETEHGSGQVEVYDITGRLITSFEAAATQGVWELDLAPMATGVYVVVLRNGTEILMQRKLQVL
ncbi:PKD repeat protein [Flavobacterium arsenatis]|uniref:PKD repeat protein n=1 Tax=Flavobacterium arsenatis TaxID=1484332 RepID=A0ABU1TTR1_9FLAO|nr:PKD domain-containing protein [Flavobacterium arsenatis]MDR6969269.1 PKD repeat protein [Flavobacterium arsenatis]